jgi:hypothetical protein
MAGTLQATAYQWVSGVTATPSGSGTLTTTAWLGQYNPYWEKPPLPNLTVAVNRASNF